MSDSRILHKAEVSDFGSRSSWVGIGGRNLGVDSTLTSFRRHHIVLLQAEEVESVMATAVSQRIGSPTSRLNMI